MLFGVKNNLINHSKHLIKGLFFILSFIFLVLLLSNNRVEADTITTKTASSSSYSNTGTYYTSPYGNVSSISTILTLKYSYADSTSGSINYYNNVGSSYSTYVSLSGSGFSISSVTINDIVTYEENSCDTCSISGYIQVKIKLSASTVGSYLTSVAFKTKAIYYDVDTENPTSYYANSTQTFKLSSQLKLVNYTPTTKTASSSSFSNTGANYTSPYDVVNSVSTVLTLKYEYAASTSGSVNYYNNVGNNYSAYVTLSGSGFSISSVTMDDIVTYSENYCDTCTIDGYIQIKIKLTTSTVGSYLDSVTLTTRALDYNNDTSYPTDYDTNSTQTFTLSSQLRFVNYPPTIKNANSSSFSNVGSKIGNSTSTTLTLTYEYSASTPGSINYYNNVGNNYSSYVTLSGSGFSISSVTMNDIVTYSENYCDTCAIDGYIEVKITISTSTNGAYLNSVTFITRALDYNNDTSYSMYYDTNSTQTFTLSSQLTLTEDKPATITLQAPGDGSVLSSVYYGKTTTNMTITITDDLGDISNSTYTWSTSSTSTINPTGISFCGKTTTTNSSTLCKINYYDSSATVTTTKISASIPTISKTGTYYLWINAKDDNYNTATSSTSYSTSSTWTIFKIIIDTTSPTVTYSSGVNSSWKSSEVTLTMYYYDSLAGVVAYSCNSGSSWTSVTRKTTKTSFSCTYSNMQTLSANTIRAKDAAGNVGYYGSTRSIYSDVTSPGITYNTGESTSWSNTSRTITMNRTDNLSGVSAITCDGGSNWTSVTSSTSSTFTCNYSDIQTLAASQMGVKDQAGNVAYYSSTRSIYSDTTSPTLTYSTGSNSSWKSSSIAVTMYYSDSLSGVVGYSCDSGSTWTTVTQTTTKTSFNCTYSNTQTLSSNAIRAKDVAGNINYYGSINIYSDVTNPGVTYNTGASTTWTNTSRTITMNRTDNLSGVSAITCDGGGSWTSVTSSTSSTFTCTYSDMKTLAASKMGVKDQAGNVAYYSSTRSIYSDVTNPGVTYNTGASSTWKNTSRTITMNRTDNLSGVSAITCDGGSNWTLVTASTSSTFTCEYSNKQTLSASQAGVKDQAGNITYYTSSINIYSDVTSPEITYNTGESTSWTNTSRTITMNRTDNLSGVSAITCDGGGSWTSVTASTSSTFTCTYSNIETLAALQMGVKDKAGNVSYYSSTRSIYSDTIAPKLDLFITSDKSVSDASDLLPGTNVYINIDDTNPLSSMKYKVYMSPKNIATSDITASMIANWEDISSFETISYEGTYYVYIATSSAYSKDKAGNILTDYYVKVGDYYVTRKSITVNTKNTTYENIENSIKEDNIYAIRKFSGNNDFVLITLNKCNDACSDSEIKNAIIKGDLGLTVVDGGVTNLTNNSNDVSRMYDNLLAYYYDDSNKYYEFMTLVIINNTPRITNDSNTGTSITIDKNETLENTGLSFASVDGSEVQVSTLITLDGVKVKSIDTSKTGVYSITTVATDTKGRSNKVVREVIVKDIETINEEIISNDVIEEASEVVAIVNTNATTNNDTEVVNNTRVVDTTQVTMRLETTTKEKKYLIKKNIKKIINNKFSFKLFSKYFFKIYDG